MSEYAEIVVQNLELASFRNYVDPQIVSLFFSERDLTIVDNCKVDESDDDAGLFTQYVFKTSVKNAKERLDALGFGVNNFEKLLENKAQEAIDYSAFLDYLHVDAEEYEIKAKQRIEKYISPKKWRNSMRKIVEYELKNGNIIYNRNLEDIGISTECDKVIYHALRDKYAESFYALNTGVISKGYIYRLILESCEDGDEISMDISCLADWAEDCIPKAIEAVKNVEKTIILLEGSSDKDFLEFAMEQLYPHLSDLYYFMDFSDENGSRDPGASFIVKNMKTFYFSKIKARFISVFDNDAEGYFSRCTLLNDVKKWPDNFRVLLYPEDPLFKHYPTIAPNGSLINDDINKKAASIELYLPDCIIQENDNYYPIEWEMRKKNKNVDGKEECLYQGVISNKDKIKKEFHKLKKQIKRGEKEFREIEWMRMKKILEMVVFAFA